MEGNRWVTEAVYDFGYEDAAGFLEVAMALENTGVAAYAGAAPAIQDKAVIAAALGIQSVEARHAAYLNERNEQSPFPGAFAPGVDEKLPGLIVLLSTSTLGARNAQNLANLFNLTGFTNQKANEIWDTWLVGAPAFGTNVRSVLRVAVAADKNKDGVFNDAPATVPDSNRDGRIDGIDLKAFGVSSEIVAVSFRIGA